MNTEPDPRENTESVEPDEDEVQNVMLQIPFPESFTYVNCAAFSISQMEIRLGFGEAMQDGKVASRGGIVLSPEAAAIIAMVLFKQVQTYEARFGEIRHPAWKAMKQGKAVQVNHKEHTMDTTAPEPGKVPSEG